MQPSLQAISALSMLGTMPPASRRADHWPEAPIAGRYGVPAILELLGASLIRRGWAFESAARLQALPRRRGADRQVLIVTERGWKLPLPHVPHDA